MAEKSIYYLTSETVSVLTQTTDEQGNINNHMCGYDNSESGRADLVANEPEEVVTEVMAVWGDNPTVETPTFTDVPEQSETSNPAESVASNVWDEMAAAIREGVNEV